VGKEGEHIQVVPELGIGVNQSKMGLVPETLRPLLAQRLAIKQQLAGMNHRDCRYQTLKARAAALKWLLVVCFGYLGYKNARFGRIESHEAVTAYGREALLQAKEAAEELGFTVLHMYVDGLWVKRLEGETQDAVQQLLDEILFRTGLPIALEGVYKWVAFLPSRLDERVPVANRYFGVFQDGVFKMRGIEARRHDTVPFVAQLQMKILERMAKVADGRSLSDCLPEVMSLLRKGLADLQTGRVPIEQLVVSQTLSRTLEEYRVPSPAARAALQLEQVGKVRRPGQRIRFIHTIGEPGVYAWDLPECLDPKTINVAYYSQLLIRAASTVLQPLGLTESVLHDWLLHHTYQPDFLSLSDSHSFLSLLV
jgi:DNA polymerase-2